MKSPMLKHIYKNNGKYNITKNINGKNRYFKRCDTLNEAIEYRDKLKQNNWEPLPLTEEEIFKKNQKEYYKGIHLFSSKRYYRANNENDEYIGGRKNIEEALYLRDIGKYKTLKDIPKDIDLVTDNPYYKEGLKYPLPERLIRPERKSNYGKGTIVKKGETSFHIRHGKKGNGYKDYVCACPTIEMAEYVRAEMNKVDWDMDELQRILDDYPRYYTKLLFFYQYISRHRLHSQSTKGKVYRGWEITIPKEFLENNNSLEKIGVYNNIEDALFERDFLIEHDWDYDLLVECIDDRLNPYYDMDLPTYPTRKIRNISRKNYHEKELTQLAELLKEYPNCTQKELADMMGTIDVNIRNWLKAWNTNYSEFKQLVLDGINPLEVLEKVEQIIQPDLSTSKPSNFNNRVLDFFKKLG